MPVCLNHTEIEATCRCTTCFKPLCSDCVVRRDRHVFCSPQCLDNYLRTSGLDASDSKKKKKGVAVVLAVIVIVTLVVIGICGFLLIS